MSRTSSPNHFKSSLHSERGWTERFKQGTINVAKGLVVLGITAFTAGAIFHALHTPLCPFPPHHG